MWRVFLSIFLLLVIGSNEAFSQADYKRYYDEDNLPKVREIFLRGRYDIVIQVCDYALRRGQPSWEWRTLRFQSLANVGRYEDAVEEAIATTDQFPDQLGALLEAHKLFSSMGLAEEAGAMFAAINEAAAAVPEKERSALDYVHLGQAALILGADPSTVIEQYFDVAKTFQAKGQVVPGGLLEAYLASGELALVKDDFGLAAKEFQGAYKLEPENPDVLFGLAESFFPSDRKKGAEYLERVLKSAPRHYGALLLQAEYAINFERYDEAHKNLDLVTALNPRHPLAAAYRAVLVELEKNDHIEFEKYRKAALSVWANNPEIDHLIGRVLSRKYRYQEGADSQKRALEMDPGFLPAKLQLALDYLRLGDIEKAWPLADEVGEQDEYNVLAFNLSVLQKEIESFASIPSDDFVIRMPPEEAEIYGDRVTELLTDAKEVLGKKYGLEMDGPTYIEFYPNQQDFAIRSFGSLGGEGLLGVCSGAVVTMNSPGSTTAGKNNWEATLWHEYCHVVTLTVTNNKMPRWLSEGISVYEEIQRQPNWGQRMTPQYRKMVLEEKAFTPISQMSQAFFNAESGEHLMFAYYQSMLVVKYIVENFGEDALRNILVDLGAGVLINDAIANHTIPIETLDSDFAQSLIKLADTYGPGVDWAEPGPEEVNPVSPLAVAAYLKKNPTNFWARQTLTLRYLEQEKWAEAAESAEKLIALLPDFTGIANGYALKARAFREEGNADAEVAVLERLADISAEAYTAYTRLLDVEFEKENWKDVITNAKRTKAINPFYERLHYCRGCAHAALAETGLAVSSFEKTLKLDPTNPSEVRYRLAGLLQKGDKPRAKRYLLDALADSPRYREAHALLLDFSEEK
ncbi:MAG: peptidase MA family metallohydrolase [Verrucomicrobiales bacterium]|nr:peptidase MA family metallohydrolase [Verrucomicrobiales bacterium]